MTPVPSPLTGFTVAVTAARRADELSALLERRGAAVLRAPALRTVPLSDDARLRDATREVTARPPDIVVATTGGGFRGWMEAADGWGEGEALRGVLEGAELLARGPKACGAIRAAGLKEAWSPASESSSEVLERLLGQDLSGRRVAVQLHGEPLHDFRDALRGAGAEVVAVPVYRWTAPVDVAPLDRLIDAVAGHGVDAVTFTSAPAAAGLFARAEERGPYVAELVTEALRGRTQVACVGPVTAAPLLARGIPAYWPERFRVAALVRQLCDRLPAAALRLPVAGRLLEVRDTAVLLDGEPRAVPPGPMAVLRVLAARPGQVITVAELFPALSGGGGGGAAGAGAEADAEADAGPSADAVEVAVARLRGALGEPGLVQIVGERGYRLALDAGDGGADVTADGSAPAPRSSTTW